MKFFERLMILLVALLMSQLPFFVDQYDMRLQAHIEEARLMVVQIQTIAEERHKSVQEYISKFFASSDPDIIAQGEFMKRILERYDRLIVFHARMVAQTSVVRPFLFPFSCDRGIALETASGFHPGVVLTVAGIVWGLLGALFGYIAVLMFRRKKKKTEVVKDKP